LAWAKIFKPQGSPLDKLSFIVLNHWIKYLLVKETHSTLIFFKTLQRGVRFHYYPDEERKIIRIRKYLTGGKMPTGYKKLTFGDLN
jgi:hypothetical protein